MFKYFFIWLLIGLAPNFSGPGSSASIPSESNEKIISARYPNTKRAIVQICTPPVGNRRLMAMGAQNRMNEISSGKALQHLREILGKPEVHRGSGFIYSYRGKKYVITNAHVIDGGSKEEIYINQGMKKYALRLLGGDTFYDIAVLTFTNPAQSADFKHTLTFSNKKINFGGNYVVVAKPDDLSRPATSENPRRPTYPYYYSKGGIVGIQPADGPYAGQLFFDTNADIIPGCSGSPLLDENDQIIGINTSRSESGNTQINSCLSGTWAKEIIGKIIDNPEHRITRGFLGMILSQKGLSRAPRGGVILKDLIPESPAYDKLKDIIQLGVKLTAINQTPIKNLEQALALLDRVNPSADVDLSFEQIHSPSVFELTVTPGKFADSQLEKIASHFLQKYVPLEPVQHRNQLELNGNFDHPNIKIKALDPVGYCCAMNDGYVTLDGSGGDSSFEKKIFMVKSLKDLGVLVRMGAYNDGRVYLFGHTDNIFKRVTLSPQDFSQGKLRLLYY